MEFQKRLRVIVGDELFSRLQIPSHWRHITNMWLLYRYFRGMYFYDQPALISLPLTIPTGT